MGNTRGETVCWPSRTRTITDAGNSCCEAQELSRKIRGATFSMGNSAVKIVAFADVMVMRAMPVAVPEGMMYSTCGDATDSTGAARSTPIESFTFTETP